jgi:hypothetical protein
VLLCRRHHRAVHEGGFAVTLGDDDTVIVRQLNGAVLKVAPRVGWHAGPASRRSGADVTSEQPLDATTRRLAAANITIGPRTIAPWDGTPFNVVYAIDVLYKSPTSHAHTT